MDEPEELVTLCDDCSKKLLEENWLGALVLESGFECMICHHICCAHLQKTGKICTSCE